MVSGAPAVVACVATIYPTFPDCVGRGSRIFCDAGDGFVLMQDDGDGARFGNDGLVADGVCGHSAD